MDLTQLDWYDIMYLVRSGVEDEAKSKKFHEYTKTLPQYNRNTFYAGLRRGRQKLKSGKSFNTRLLNPVNFTKSTTGKIYRLCVDIHPTIIYIGQTTRSLEERFDEHWNEILNSRSDTMKAVMLKACLDEGCGVGIALLEDNVPVSELHIREKFWIDVSKKLDFFILNEQNPREYASYRKLAGVQ